MQFDVAVGIRVRDGEDLAADGDVGAEFLFDLAPQARLERLSLLALAAGELPVAFEMHALLPPRDEIAIVILDDGGRDDDSHARSRSGLNGYDAQSRRIGQTRHFGLRAVHSVAPKSISAWLKSNTCRCGSTARDTVHRCFFIACDLASPRPTNTRKSTRATFVSRMAARLPKAKLITAPAVYSPMPLNDRSVASSSGSWPP